MEELFIIVLYIRPFGFADLRVVLVPLPRAMGGFLVRVLSLLAGACPPSVMPPRFELGFRRAALPLLPNLYMCIL